MSQHGKIIRPLFSAGAIDAIGAFARLHDLAVRSSLYKYRWFGSAEWADMGALYKYLGVLGQRQIPEGGPLYTYRWFGAPGGPT